MKKVFAALALSAVTTLSFAHNHMSGDATVLSEPMKKERHHKMAEHHAKWEKLPFAEKKAWASKHLDHMSSYLAKKKACVDAAQSEDELSACKGKRHHR